MQTPHSSNTPVRLTLGCGDRRQVQVARGTQILNLGGWVLVEQAWDPADGRPDIGAQRLCDGETLVIDRHTWVTLTACAETDIVCLPPPPAPRMVASLVRLWVALNPRRVLSS